jgi:hypothetical protein
MFFCNDVPFGFRHYINDKICILIRTASCVISINQNSLLNLGVNSYEHPKISLIGGARWLRGQCDRHAVKQLWSFIGWVTKN